MSLTVVSDAVIIYDCETVIDSVGNKTVLNDALVKHNLESLSANSEINKPYIGFSGVIPDLTDKHFRMWYMSMTYPNIDIKENGGVSLYMFDINGNAVYWFIAGSDTYAGGWINLLVYTGSVPDLEIGTIDFTNITEIGITPRNGTSDGYLSDPKSGDNVWIDYLRYADGLICYGLNWGIEDVAMADQAPGVGFGVVQGDKSVIHLHGSLVYGITSEVTKYADDGVTIIFADNVTKEGLYGIRLVGDDTGASEFELTNSVILSNINKYYLDLDDVKILKLTLTGNLISGAGDIYLLGNVMYSNITANLFNKCGAIHPQGARFENNSINESTGETASLYLNTPNEISATKNIFYTKYLNKYALHIGAGVTGTISLDSHIFDGTGIDIYWAGTVGTLIVKLVNNSNASTFNTAGGTIEFLVVDNVAIDYDQVNIMIVNNNQQILDLLGSNSDNVNQLLLALGDKVSENQSTIVSKSGNTQMSL